MEQKPLHWCGSSLEDLRAFPEAARREAGYQIDRVQVGKAPKDAKPMATVGRGVWEIRIHTGGLAHRVFYIAKFEEAVHVLHAFEKKTQKTASRDLETGRRRYKELLKARNKPGG